MDRPRGLIARPLASFVRAPRIIAPRLALWAHQWPWSSRSRCSESISPCNRCAPSVSPLAFSTASSCENRSRVSVDAEGRAGPRSGDRRGRGRRARVATRGAWTASARWDRLRPDGARRLRWSVPSRRARSTVWWAGRLPARQRLRCGPGGRIAVTGTTCRSGRRRRHVEPVEHIRRQRARERGRRDHRSTVGAALRLLPRSTRHSPVQTADDGRRRDRANPVHPDLAAARDGSRAGERSRAA